MHSKVKELYSNLTKENLRNICRKVINCDLGYPDYYSSNESFWNEKDNSCLNLEFDLADQGAKVWRNPKRISSIKTKGYSCFINEERELKNIVNDLQSEEKKIVQELIDVLHKFRLEYNQNSLRFEENFVKFERNFEEMKKAHDESCKCKSI